MTIPVLKRDESAWPRLTAWTNGALNVVRDRVSWTAWVIVVLGVVTLLSRAPGLLFTGMFDRDESYLAVTGDVLRGGGQLYVDVIDRKPPVAPVFYALIREWSVDMRAVRFVLALLIFFNGIVIVEMVRRLSGSRRAALFGGVLSIVGTAMFLPPDAQAANFELWGMLPASAAVLCVVVARLSRRPSLWFVFAGALVVIAANCKQPYIVVGLVVLFEAWRRVSIRWRCIAGTGIGAVVAFVPFIAFFNGPLLWRWVWADNSDYLNGGVSMARAALAGLGLTVIFAVFHVPFFYGVWAAATRRVRVDPLIVVWAVASLLVIPIGFRFFGHYYQQLIPPLSVMTAIALPFATPRVWRSLAVFTVATFVVLSGLSYVHRPDLSNFTALGRYVQESTDIGQRILVWGALPDVYVSSQRLPSGIFLHGGYLTGNWASRDEPLPNVAMNAEPFASRWKMFFDDVATNPPELVIDAARPGTDWSAYGPDNYPIGEWLRRCYVRDVVVDGLPVWRRDAVACLN